MKWIFCALIYISYAYASDEEVSSMSNTNNTYYYEEEDVLSDLLDNHEETIHTIEDLEYLRMNSYIESQKIMPCVADILGIRLPRMLKFEDLQKLPLDERFINIIPGGMNLLQIRPHLNYEALKDLFLFKGIKTSAGIFMSFCSLNPSKSEECLPLSDCKMLENITPDMSAYCTIKPYSQLHIFKSVEGLSMEQGSEIFDIIKREVFVNPIDDLKDIKMKSGLPKQSELSLEAVQINNDKSFRALVCCPIYRLYKGCEVIGLFSLVTIKIQAHDRAEIVRKFLPDFMKNLAKEINQTQISNCPDYSKFTKKDNKF